MAHPPCDRTTPGDDRGTHPGSPIPARFDRVGLSVRDLAAAQRFYGAVFDLTEEFRFRVPRSVLEAVVLCSHDGWGLEGALRDAAEQACTETGLPDPS